ncbi:MAG: class I SAM-dependent methyltransferase [Chlorobi bacterium]|nr:class I SAM-dependent methyltransferase [Chlorobiota bacterium]
MKTTKNTPAVKDQVRDYWNNQPCGTQFTEALPFSKEYFANIEEHRYTVEPEIFSFAQFTRYREKKILEVGTGAGSDFTQWVRSGANATGIDATEAGVQHTTQRLLLEGLNNFELIVGDCEKLPFPENTFDLVYSWGVIHHTPNTWGALSEIIRVCKPGGEIKVMIYHRHSLLSLFFWVKYALLKGRPWKSLSWCLSNYMESVGTKAYTRKEVQNFLIKQPVNTIKINTYLTFYDRLERFGTAYTKIAQCLAWLLGGNRVGWFLTIRAQKNQ